MEKLKGTLFALISGLAAMILAGHATAQTFTNVHSFEQHFEPPLTTPGEGNAPRGTLVLAGNSLFGTASGGAYGGGTIFRVNTDGTGFTNLHHFKAFYSGTNSDGASPDAGLVVSGNTLYGTTIQGGSLGGGTVFALATDGTGFTNLHNFTDIVDGTNAEGASPSGRLLLSGNTLYGTTDAGGTNRGGIIFRINTDGTGFTNIYNLSFGAFQPGLIISSNTLYGIVHQSAAFSVNTDGSGFTILHDFDSPDGDDQPLSELVLSGKTLYGAAYAGGLAGAGTVYAMNTDGTGFTNLYTFTATSVNFVSYAHTNGTGANPFSELFLSGKTLYGTTCHGGLRGQGVIFAINTDGSGFTNLYNFTGNNDGSGPIGGLILSGDTLYGTANEGGNWGNGTVFSLTLPPVIAPQLAIIFSGPNVVVSWPTNSTADFALQSTTNLLAPAWSPVCLVPTVLDGQKVVTNSMSGPQMFFRLSQ